MTQLAVKSRIFWYGHTQISKKSLVPGKDHCESSLRRPIEATISSTKILPFLKNVTEKKITSLALTNWSNCAYH